MLSMQERHDEHHPGTWVWPHMNTTVQWTDWADGQPNNYQVEHDIIYCRQYTTIILGPELRDHAGVPQPAVPLGQGLLLERRGLLPRVALHLPERVQRGVGNNVNN